jgi:beta-N-acetylhexosaminidase
LLSLSGVILILTAVLLGLISFLAIRTLRKTAHNGQLIAPTVQTVGLPPAIENAGVTPPASIRPSQTAAVRATPQVDSGVDIDRLLNNMSLEEKFGQMIMTGFLGRNFDAGIASLIETYHFGSVVYFAENTHHPAQILKLSQDLQRSAASSGHGVPLLIAVDHEGGAVFRFAKGLTHFANPMTLGAAASPELAYQVAAASAQELQAVGINTSLGPVLDVNDEPLNPVIGVRAFGGYPDLVNQIGEAYLHGLQDNGVIAAAKHFPGHGSTIEDSHIVLPIVNKTEQQLDANELVPFRSVIPANPGIIMVGHVSFPQVDPSGAPATLSPVWIEQKLRSEFGFSGVVMTDAMTMGAITNRYSPAQAAVLAVKAGNDLLSYPQAEAAIAAYQAILAGVQDGSIPRARVEASARRVLELKAKYHIFDSPPTPVLEEHDILARQAARVAVVFSGKRSAPLISSGKLLLVTPSELPPGNVPGDNLSLLGELLQMQGLVVDEWVYTVQDPQQSAAIQAQIQQALPENSQTVIVLWDARLQQAETGNFSQRNLVQAVLEGGLPAVFVAANSPYDLSMLPADQPALATFGGLNYQVEILAQTLLSGVLPAGKLPILVTH